MKQPNFPVIALSLWSITLLTIAVEKLIWIQAKLGSLVESIQLVLWQLKMEPDGQIAIGVVIFLAFYVSRRGADKGHCRSPLLAINFHTVALLSAFLAIPYLWCYGGKTASFLLSKAGYHSLAEDIFAVVRDRRDISVHNSVAGYLWTYRDERIPNILAVGAVMDKYGASSLEMASLDLERGIQCRQNYDFANADRFLKHSYAIYSACASDKPKIGYVSALCAINLLDLHDTPQSKRFFKIATSMSNKCSDRDLADNNIPELLLVASTPLGLEISENLQARSYRIKTIESTKSIFLN
jgi:hypothetical protein